MTPNMQTVLEAPPAVTKARPFYVRVTTLGFGLIALAGIVVLIFGALGGDLAASANYGIAYLVIGLLVGGAPFSLFSFVHPESAADFVPLVVSVAGGLLGLVGSVGALAQSRRPPARAQSTRVERWALGGLLGVVAVASVLSIGLTLAGRTAVSAADKTGAANVQMHNFAFAPNALLVSAGGTVRIVVKNNDATLHTFTLPQAGVDVSVPPGSEKVIEFKAPAAGTYQWFCIPHSSLNGATRDGMVGTLTAH